jgi:hypothetical protein
MRVYEIESKNGSTLCAFRVDDNGNVIETSKNVRHHDSDGDYIFESKDQLERIQLKKREE